MRNPIYILLFLLLSSMGVQAQDNANREKIRAAKIALVTERLSLSADQAAKFWPVYNKYEEERRSLRRIYKAKYAATGNAQDKGAAMEFVNNNLEFQEQELEIKKRYKTEMLRVISAQQLAALYDAERDFKKMLLQQLREQK